VFSLTCTYNVIFMLVLILIEINKLIFCGERLLAPFLSPNLHAEELYEYIQATVPQPSGH
jgi:hypothetical protein